MIVSMAAPATAIAASSSSFSTSVPLCNKLPHFLPSNYHSLSPFPTTHFTPITPKPLLNPLRLRAQFPRTPRFSLIFRSLPTLGASAAFTGQPESETQSEKEERENDDDDGKEQTETGGRLYVGNLPYTTTASELGDIFGEAGRVASVEIVYDRLTDRSRGFGFVTMGSVEEAKEAIRMFDGSQIGGRTVKVNFPEVPKGGEREVMGPRMRNSIQAFVDSPYKLYAGNLSWNITSQGLSEAFADQPGLLSAKVVYDRDSGRSRGFGFVSFSSAKEMESALSSMNGVEVEGRPLRLNKAMERGTSSRQAINSENSFDDSEMLSSFSS